MFIQIPIGTKFNNMLEIFYTVKCQNKNEMNRSNVRPVPTGHLYVHKGKFFVLSTLPPPIIGLH